MIQEIKFGTDANTLLQKGINTVADAVKSTFGPHGRNVIIERQDTPHITKDGVTVAQSINLEDKFENIGANLIKDVALKTCKDVGDGTTTSTILTQFIINEGLKSVNFGVNAFELKRGMEKATLVVSKALKNSAKPISTKEDILSISKISTNGDIDLSLILTSIFDKIGKDGVITIEDSENLDTYSTIIEGLQLDNGYFHSSFCIDNPVISYENVWILVSNKKISELDTITKTLQMARDERRPVVIIAPDFSKPVLDSLLMNNYNGVVQVCAVKAPGFNEQQKNYLEDLSIVVGSSFLEKNSSMILGEANKVIITEYNTTIIGGAGSKESVDARITYINKLIDAQKDLYVKDRLKERVAKLSSTMAVLHVGALSEVELIEKKDRIDDAVHAIKAALQEGIVVGSGLSLLRASQELDILVSPTEDDRRGVLIIKAACRELIKQLLTNAEEDLSIITKLYSLEDLEIGYNFITKTYENFFEKGIVDPVKVVYTALLNSVSVASLFLTTNCVIINKE